MKRLTVLLYSILLCIGAIAQNIQITVSAPEIVEEGTVFHVRYTINASPDNLFSVETCDEIQASGGRPQTNTSSKISIVNGNVTQSKTYSETRQFRATKKGKYPIPVASIKIDGKTYKSEQRTIEVVDNVASANAAAKTQAQRSQNNTGGSKSSSSSDNLKPETTNENIFARILVNKSSAYIGEPILATVKLYTTSEIGYIDHTMPNCNGFFKRILEQPQTLEYNEEVINGKHFYTILFQKLVLYPQKSGKLTITPFKLECNVINGYTFGGFFGFPQQKVEHKLIESKPVTINVKDLPQGQNADFSGAVGSFSMNAETDKTTIPANEAFSLKVVVKGSGNFSLLTQPNIQFPQDFEVYDPKITDNFSLTASGEKGSKTYEYVIIPRQEGSFTIPAISLQYFNLESKSYKTITTEPINIAVTKGNGTSQTVTNNYAPTIKEDVQFGNDIQFIKTGITDAHKKQTFFFLSPLYWILFIACILGTIIFIFLRRKSIERHNDVSGMKQRGADKESRKRLKTAKKFLDNNDDTSFYEELAKALWGFVADKFTIPQVDLTTDKIKEKLLEKNIEEPLIDRLLHILQRCEFARFAPSQDSQGKEDLYNQACEIIQEFGQKIK